MNLKMRLFCCTSGSREVEDSHDLALLCWRRKRAPCWVESID